MTLPTRLADAINDQIQWEFYSGYLYLAMEAHFRATGLPGAAHWMRKQAQEELEHAMKFVDYVYARESRVVRQAIQQPPAAFGEPVDVFGQALAHEQEVSRRIDSLVALANQERDAAAVDFLQWYVNEQVEEEENAGKYVTMLQAAGDDESAAAEVDRQLARRGV